MFTGIIEELGTLKNICHNKKSSVLVIEAEKVLQDTKIGDSIAVNGVCLTVRSMTSRTFETDVMAETMRRTNMVNLTPGGRLNLERALSLNTRLGGHIISGHIDGTGTIRSFEKEENAVWVTIDAEPEILRYIVEKGSIAIDGISLTVAFVNEDIFQISMIPHTGEMTGLLRKKPGDTVNLECDVIGKYVEKLLGIKEGKQDRKRSSISLEFLENSGFL